MAGSHRFDVNGWDEEKETADLSTALRSGPTARRGRRDDKSVAGRDTAFPGKVRGTADPSASLLMNNLLLRYGNELEAEGFGVSLQAVAVMACGAPR
jgi:hypothetical protein